jgi:hypothetical protein
MPETSRKRCVQCGASEIHAPRCPIPAAVARHERRCPDCGGAMHPLRVGGNAYLPIPYIDEDAQPSWMTGLYPTTGFVHAYLCAGCSGVRFYAVSSLIREGDPTADLPIPASPSTSTADLPRPGESPPPGRERPGSPNEGP